MEQRTCSLGTFCDMWDPLTQQVYIVVSSMQSFLNRHSLYVAVGRFCFLFFFALFMIFHLRSFSKMLKVVDFYVIYKPFLSLLKGC